MNPSKPEGDESPSNAEQLPSEIETQEAIISQDKPSEGKNVQSNFELIYLA